MTFKKRVIIVLACFLFIFLGILSALIYSKTSAMLNIEALKLMDTKLHNIVDNLEITIELNKEKIKSISKDNDLLSYFNDKSLDIDKYLSDLLIDENLRGEYYKDIIVINKEGLIIESASKHANGYDISEREYFKISKFTKGVILSKTIVAKADKDFITVVISPVFYNKNVIGYVGLVLYSQGFTDYISKSTLGNTGHYIIVDSNNIIIFHRDENKLLKTGDYNLIEHDFKYIEDKIPMLGARIKLQLNGSNWNVIALLSEKEVYKNSRNLLNYILLLGMFFTGISILMSIYLSNTLINPIIKLTQIIKKSAFSEKKYNIDLIEESEMVSQSILGIKTENIIEVNDLKEAIYSMKKNIKNSLIRNNEENGSQIERYLLVLSQRMHSPLIILKSEIKNYKENSILDIEKVNDSIKNIEKYLYRSISEIDNINFSKLLIKEEMSIDKLINSIYEVSKEFIKENDKIFIYINESRDSNDKIIKIDLQMIIRTWMSFLINAVTYTDNKGEITLKIEKTEKYLRVELIDNGKGIVLEDIDNLYDEFYNQHHENNTVFNMIIAKKILDEHNFKIGLRSLDNYYTRVWFDIEI